MPIRLLTVKVLSVVLPGGELTPVWKTSIPSTWVEALISKVTELRSAFGNRRGPFALTVIDEKFGSRVPLSEKVEMPKVLGGACPTSVPLSKTLILRRALCATGAAANTAAPTLLASSDLKCDLIFPRS